MKKKKPQTDFEKYLCLNKMCNLCTDLDCPKKKYTVLDKSLLQVDTLIAIKTADIDIWLDKKDKYSKRKVKKLMKELTYLKKLFKIYSIDDIYTKK